LALLIISSHSSWGQEPEKKQEPSTAPSVTTDVKVQEKQESFNLTKYRPIYFLWGEPSSKLQVSFKYQLVKVWPIYFAYTQRMFWDLTKDSKPLRDINYNPEIFGRIEVSKDVLESIDIGPYEHLSNGRSGAESRSLNRAFVQFNVINLLKDNVLRFSVRLSHMYGLDETNGDLADYVSPLDFQATFTQFAPWILDRGEFYFRIFAGGHLNENWSKGAQEVGVSFRLGQLDITPSIFIQYYNGYVQSLMDYNKSESQFRIGLLL
jgi:phospholipase A1/A2